MATYHIKDAVVPMPLPEKLEKILNDIAAKSWLFANIRNTRIIGEFFGLRIDD